MRALGWLAVASVCLGMLGAVPAEESRKEEKPRQADLPLSENLDLGNYELSLDNYGEVLDLSNYEELYDYGEPVPRIEVGTLAPRPQDPKTLPGLGETTAGTPKLQPPSGADPAPAAPTAGQGPPSCLPCLCLGSSAYCEDAGLERLPALPAGTEFLYGRFNRLRSLRARDLRGLERLQRLDLSHNGLRWAEAGALRALRALRELLLARNALSALPELPRALRRLDLRGNRLGSGALRAFGHLKHLQFLHLSDNQLDFIPVPLPQSLRSLHLQNNLIRTIPEDAFCDRREQAQIRRALEDIRLDGNPVNLSLFPSAFFCLPRLPTGRFS